MEDLQKVCRLDPPRDLKKVDNKSAMSTSKATDPNTALYARKAAEVRRLREEISRVNRELQTLRGFYNSAPPSQKEEMADKIRKKEARLPGLSLIHISASRSWSLPTRICRRRKWTSCFTECSSTAAA